MTRVWAGFGGGFQQGFDGFQGFDFDINFGGQPGGFADAIKDMFHGMMNRGADVQIDLTILFEEAVFGTRKKITIPYRRKGTETVEVGIPAGIEPGMRVKLQGRGEPSKDGKAPPGDLYIRVLVQEHKQFERHGGDIVGRLNLTPTEALLGTTKELRDVKNEKLSVTVPEMSNEGSPIIFQGRGIPQPAGTGRLVILCHIVYPRSISKKARDLLSELRKEGW